MLCVCACVNELYFNVFIGKQQLLAAGDEVGTLHIMEVPWNLRHAPPNEVSFLRFEISFLMSCVFHERGS